MSHDLGINGLMGFNGVLFMDIETMIVQGLVNVP